MEGLRKTRVSVLIIDDSQTFSMYLALLLQRMGFKSLRVSQVESAKFVLSRGFTDILIIGDLVGGGPKHQMVEELAVSCQATAIPILTISRYEDPLDKQACHAAGCSACLLKPIQPKALHDALYDNITTFPRKRLHLRSKVAINAEISISGQVSQPLRLLNLSRGGALVAFNKNIPVGTNISMNLPLKHEEIRLKGSVIYNLSNIDAETGQAFAVFFHQLTPLLGDKIERYLMQILTACQASMPRLNFDVNRSWSDDTERREKLDI